MSPDSPSYVKREADHELFRRVMDGEYCYVLTPRQMGKSSLMARTAKHLRFHGARTAILDLTGIGGAKGQVTADQWYFGFAYQLARELRIERDLDLQQWWRERDNLPPLQRLSDFLRAILLNSISSPIAIFVDEIDTTIGLPFADDFFAGIRAAYNARALDAAYQRLTFVLLGVASPTQLIKDTRRTPFNIGRQVELTDFSLAEARVLVEGLRTPSVGERLLRRILYWTGGHPYLTQKLCRAVAEEVCDHTDLERFLDQLVERFFFGPHAIRTEDNLKFVAGRLTSDLGSSKALLRLLTRIQHGTAVVDDPISPLHAALKLSGVVAPGPDGKLAIRNRIYDRVFTAQWAKTDRVLAAMWVRRSLKHAAAGQRDQALLSRLRALEFEPSDLHRSEAGHLVSDDFAVLSATLRHSGPLTAVAWNPDGATVITGSEDHTAQLWDAVSGEPRGACLRHRGPVWAVAFSPDGAFVATASRDGAGRIWRADSGDAVSPPLRHRGPVWVVKFSPDGKTLLTASDDGTVRLWKTESGESRGITLKHDSLIEAASFTPDGTGIVTTTQKNELRLWSTETGCLLGAPVKLDGRTPILAFSPDGSGLLTAGENKTGTLWRIDPQFENRIKRVFISPPEGEPFERAIRHENSIQAARFTFDGAMLVTGSEDKTACVWETCSGSMLGRPLLHEDWVRTVDISPNGSVAATGTEDRNCYLWGMPSGVPLAPRFRHEARVIAARFSPDGRSLVTANYDGTARIWSVENVERDGGIRHDAPIAAVAFGSDGRLLATSAEDRTVRVWESVSGALVCALPLQDATERILEFAPDRNLLLTAGGSNNALLWDVQTGKPEPFFFKHDSEIRAAVFSHDGKVVATGSDDMTVRVWSARSGGPLPATLRHRRPVEMVCFSPGDRYLLTVTNDSSAHVWALSNGEYISALYHEGRITAIAFAAGGKRIVATGSDDGTARLWNAGTGLPQSIPLQHNGPVRAVAFSPDGSLLATGDDHNLCLYRTDFGAPLIKPLAHADPVTSVRFSPDGKLIVCITGGWVHVYTANGKAVASRLLPGIWAGAQHYLAATGRRIRVAVRRAPDIMLCVDLDVEKAGLPLEGDPQRLLDTWTRRVGLIIDSRDRIIPRSPQQIKARR